jgi:phosphoesterase RecJ-like protein
LNNSDYNQLLQQINTSSSIVITSHHNPDGDAVGSAMALYHVLKQIHENVSVVLPNRFPDFLRWIDESDRAVIFDQNPEADMAKVFKNAAIIFCLDYNSLSRVQTMEEHIRNATATKVLIDHHPNPEENDFDLLLSKTSASSTAELVYEFLVSLNFQHLINRSAAESLYTGIVTDTGSFSFACNNAETYRITADLIDRGVNAEQIHRLIYDNYSESRLRLMGYAFDQKLIMLPEFRTAIIWFSKAELEKFNHKTGDTEGLVNYPLSIKEINMSIFLTERDGLIRLSFRSKGDFAVNQIANKYFDGGGHKNAAGGNSYQTMDETLEKIKQILPLYQHELDYSIQ